MKNFIVHNPDLSIVGRIKGSSESVIRETVSGIPNDAIFKEVAISGDYQVKDYELDGGGNPILRADASDRLRQRIKDAVADDKEFKVLRLAFSALITQHNTVTGDTYTMAQLLDDIVDNW